MNCELKSIIGTELHITAANGTQIPYIGYVDVNLRLKSSDHELVVPMLFSKKDIDLPINSNSVIQEITRDPVSGQALVSAAKVVEDTFPCTDAENFLNLISYDSEDIFSTVKSTKRDKVIPKGVNSKGTLRTKLYNNRV